MINEFRERFYFLSNFYDSPITYRGITYQNNEAAFQAQKTLSDEQRHSFSCLNPSEAKKRGRQIELRKDWEDIKYDEMYGIVKAKFSQNKDLRELLIRTGNVPLIEENTWHDNIWGNCTCPRCSHVTGENHLGKILMKVRSELQFNAEEEKDKIAEWIRKWFDQNGKNCNAVIGISGGKDSSIVAALCVEALGKDRVIGVLMPNGRQKDIDYSYSLVNLLGIKYYACDIGEAVNSVIKSITCNQCDISEQTIFNLPPRIRMATLYAVSQSNNGRVANTCNLSEDWIGWNTRYGDSAGDFAPLANLTATEVKKIGKVLNLPDFLIEKIPEDGLCGKSDEEKFGFTYDVLDAYIRYGYCEDKKIQEKIDEMHTKNLFKMNPMDSYITKREP